LKRRERDTKGAIEWIKYNKKRINDAITHYGTTPFLTACGYGDFEVLEALVRKGVDIHQKDNYERNGAYIAVMNNNLKTLKKVKDLGLNIYEPNEDGYSPLMFAAYRNYVDIVKFLIESGIDVDVNDSRGYDFLFFVEQGECKIDIPYLVKHLDLFNEGNQKRIKKMRLRNLLEGVVFNGTSDH
jgi:ankyrin repeat protein